MSNDDDNDLTDIRQLPDLDESVEEGFESLDEIAHNMGLTEPPEFPTPPEDNSAVPDFNFQEQEESSIFESDSGEKETTHNEAHFSDSEEEADFSSSDNETDFGDSEEEADFSSSDNEADFGDSEEETDFSSSDNETDFGDSEEEEADFSSSDNETDFGESENESEFTISKEKTTFADSEVETDFGEGDDETEALFEDKEVTAQSQDFDIQEALQTKNSNSLSKTQVDRIEQTHSTPPEDFEEFKKFSQNMVPDSFSGEGNPPFSIIIKDIRYHEDASDILEMLIENKIINEEDLSSAKESLLNGRFLIPRLSEFAAIYLSHQLRRFDLEILMGLTEEIHPPKSYESNDRGLASRRTIKSNKKHHLLLSTKDLHHEVLTTTLPQLTDHKVRKYIGIVTEIKNIKPEELSSTDLLENEILEQIPTENKESLELLRLKRENKLSSESKFGFSYKDFYQNKAQTHPHIGLENVYADLIAKIKLKAKIQNANGIIGISFNITPVVVDEYVSSGATYQILCTGNMVWLEKN